MSVSIEMKEIPAWTIQQVHFEDNTVFIEAWANEDFEKDAIRSACGKLQEGDVVFLEARDSYGDDELRGTRRIAWIHLRETGESRRSKLVLQMALHKGGSALVQHCLHHGV